MTKRIAFLMTVLAAGTAFAGLPNWVRLSSLGAPESAVPFATVEQVARARAQTMWNDVIPGDVVPMSDAEGNVIAYTFHYRIDGKPFPEFAVATAEIAEEMPGLASPDAHSRYAYVVASARYDRAPVLCYGEGGTEFFVTLERARERARNAIGGEPVLTRVYYIYPLSYFEFRTATGSIVLEAHTFTLERNAVEFVNYVRTIEQTALVALGDELEAAQKTCAAKMRAEWDFWTEVRDQGSGAGGFDTTIIYVQGYQLAPFYDWSYGCSPTAATMEVGYLDEAQGYGRDIYDFFQRWDCVEGENDRQIPWAQREMALAFNTDSMTGGTYVNAIGPGLAQFGGDKGYSFEIWEFPGGWYNDWAWPSDSDEISNGWSMVWSVGWPATQMYHSLTALGIRLETKDLYVHNTWWTPAAWWHYTDGGSISTANLASVHPTGATERRIRVVFPRGDTLYNHTGSGEVLWVGRESVVRWNNYGMPGDSVNIDLTTDAGWTWQTLAHGVPDTGAWLWDISPGTPASVTARLRMKKFYGGTYTAGDGSYGDFRLCTTPLGPTMLAPANGRPLTVAPVVLTIGPMQYVDSFKFICYTGGDTLWNSSGLVLQCTVPTNLFTYGRYYNWRASAHNSFGWGDWSGPWSFLVRFAGVEDAPGPGMALALSVEHGLARERASLRMQVPEAGRVSLVVFDVTGRPVRALLEQQLAAGVYEPAWDRRDEHGRLAAAGCYFVRLNAAGRSIVRKLELVE
jgi:hypothetical protein